MTYRPDWHWCWIAGRQRVKRVGPAMDCERCRAWKKRHKCGFDPDYKTAWKPYPAEECAGCNPSRPPGDISEGASLEPPPKKEPLPLREPKTKQLGVGTKAGHVRAKHQRRMLLVLAVSSGATTTGKLLAALEAFGLKMHRRALADDLFELVEDRWLCRVQVELEGKRQPFMKDFAWHYEVNPAVLARLETEDA